MLFLLTHALDRAAEKNADGLAVRCDQRTLSYRELAGSANALAHRLVQMGVRRGDRVGVYLHKSLESAVALWGIMKAGGVYVPLDPTTPTTSLAAILRHCGIHYLATEDDLLHGLRPLIEDGVVLQGLIGPVRADDLSLSTTAWSALYAAPAHAAPEVGLIEQDLAYIMYTSGSTGEPKGIMHTHHSGLSYAQWAAHEYGLLPSDRIANHAPLHFDISTFDWFAGALAGAGVVVIPEEYTRLPASYSKLLADERITVIFTVPFALVQLLLRGVLEKRDLSALRWVIFGGEPFPPKHLRSLMECLPQARFSNIYGPAEVNGVTFYHVPELPVDPNEPIPIGQVCPFAQALVVDEADQPAAEGEVGELLIRSPTMMGGYWDRPDLNQHAFYHSPMPGGCMQVFYRTGDLVRQQPGGLLRFLGRKDRQIKSRGYRIELDAIEAALLVHEKVAAAAVFMVPDEDGNNRIQAAVIPREGATVTAIELSRHVAARLPWYAVPADFAIMSDFPRTASDKISRRKLQAAAIAAQTQKE